MRRRIQHVHFVGVGGIGMCGLAELLHNQGYRVSGTDLRAGPTVERLRGLGVAIEIGHDATHVGDADVVVYSSAVRATNPELAEAEQRKIPAIPRAEMLAEVMRLKEGIAVAGSHGKTTTTSLVAHVLGAAGLDPTAVIGGRVLAPDASPTTTRLGTGDLLVAEADESDGSFLRLAPVIGVITNIDPEHLDHYGDYATLEDAFVSFANRVPFWGLNVLCLDHPGVQAILPRMTRRTVTYGFASQADLVASDPRPDGEGMRFAVRRRDAGAESEGALGEVKLSLPGRHNVQNALATIAVALELDVPFPVIARALESFVGIERRFQRRGSAGGVSLVDDYGHHPAEIRATLTSAREIHDGRLVVAFQPHRYSRTRDLWDDFAAAFNDADVLLLTEIYSAGETKLPGVEASELAGAIRSHGHRDVHFVPELDALPDAIARAVQPGDLVVTLGAGNISGLGDRILAALGERA